MCFSGINYIHNVVQPPQYLRPELCIITSRSAVPIKTNSHHHTHLWRPPIYSVSEFAYSGYLGEAQSLSSSDWTVSLSVAFKVLPRCSLCQCPSSPRLSDALRSADATFCLSIHSSVDTWVASTFWPLVNNAVNVSAQVSV